MTEVLMTVAALVMGYYLLVGDENTKENVQTNGGEHLKRALRGLEDVERDLKTYAEECKEKDGKEPVRVRLSLALIVKARVELEEIQKGEA